MSDSNTVDQITSEVDLFGPIMQQSVLLNEFDREYAPLASLQQGAPIEFMVKGADQLYIDLNESPVLFLVKMANADGTDPIDNSVGPVNLTMHSLFSQMNVEFNGKPVSEPNHLYPYRAYLETVINYSEETQKTRLLSEGWTKDTAGHMAVTNVTGDNLGLRARAARFRRGNVVQLMGRPHLDMFQQDRLIPPGVDVHLKLIPAARDFVCKSAAPQNNGVQENYKPVIQFAGFIVHTKQLTSEAELAHRALLREKVMRLPYTRVQVKHLSIPANQTHYNFDNIFTGALPDLVVVGLLDDADFAGGYQRNPFNFQNFGVNRMELRRNGMPVPRFGYTPNFDNGQYIKDYITMQTQLGFGKGDKCVSLTPTKWAEGYTIYAFQITDGPIGSGTEGPRSRSTTGAVRLEVGFAAAQNTNIKVIVLSQSLGVLEFDEFKNVVIS